MSYTVIAKISRVGKSKHHNPKKPFKAGLLVEVTKNGEPYAELDGAGYIMRFASDADIDLAIQAYAGIQAAGANPPDAGLGGAMVWTASDKAELNAIEQQIFAGLFALGVLGDSLKA